VLQVFQVAQRAGWIPEGVKLEHVPFGLVQVCPVPSTRLVCKAVPSFLAHIFTYQRQFVSGPVARISLTQLQSQRSREIGGIAKCI
jgi:hypothetical protein